MKKKALMVLLPLCVAMAITACGGNADTTEVEEQAATEESAESQAQAEAEAEAKAREEAEEQARLEEASGYYEAGRKSLYGLDGAQVDMEDAYTNFTKAQELGNTDANFYLGVLTDWYKYPEQDYELARAYYEQCEDNPYAQISLGFLYYNFQGVEWSEENSEKGQKLFHSVVDQGIADGYLGLAAIEYNEEDYETALEDYQKVAEEGTEQLYVVSAMKDIGNMYRYGEGVEEDGVKAIEWYTKAADLGDSDAMNMIGNMYDWDSRVEQDYNTAIEWYTKAADSGSSDAMNRIGVMYNDGVGVAQDYDVAMEWYQKAADLDHTQAMCNLARMYRYGDGVAQDANTAIEWYTKAADLGSSSALEQIGDMYRNGDGIARDDDAALEWYVKSLSSSYSFFAFESIMDILHGYDATLEWFEESGDTEAMVAIGYMFCHTYGNYSGGELPDDEKAMEWLQKAADLGDASAFYHIGYMYERGRGVEPDYDKAIEWYTKAADSGDETAKSVLEWYENMQ